MISDYFAHARILICDILLWIYWKTRLGSLGKKAKIKPGLKVIGNARRIRVGKHFKIWHQCILSVGFKGRIIIENNGLLGVRSYLNASDGTIKIGNNVAIAPYCKFFTYSHHYKDGLTYTRCHIKGDIDIKDNVLIGSNCVVLPGISIGENSIIASGAVVVSDVPAGTIYGGVPAKEIKKVSE